MLPLDLEQWLTEAGDRVLHRPQPWSPGDQLLHEVWLFDTQARNGGVPQYFGNYPERWPTLLERTAQALPEFEPVAAAVERVIAGADDPFEPALAAEAALDAVWEEHRERVVAALRAVTDAPAPASAAPDSPAPDAPAPDAPVSDAPASGAAASNAAPERSPLESRLEPILARGLSELEGPADGEVWTVDLEPGLAGWMTAPLPDGALVFAANGVGDHLFLSPEEDAVMVFRHEGGEVDRYCDRLEELDPGRERRASDHPPVRYHGSGEAVRLGDRVEVRYRLFFKATGRVIYVPGVSPRRPALERDGLAWVAIRFDDGGGIETVVMPDGALKKTVRRIERDSEGDGG